jgi:hypothetical protein
LACSAPVLVSLGHVQKCQILSLGWTTGWTATAGKTGAQGDRSHPDGCTLVHEHHGADEGASNHTRDPSLRPWRRRRKRGDTRTAPCASTRSRLLRCAEKGYSDACGLVIDDVTVASSGATNRHCRTRPAAWGSAIFRCVEPVG